MEFKDWFNLIEASFKPEDVPNYFYVSIRFSEDLLKPKSFTPSGAVCSLIGLEGISERPLMWSRCGLKMPAKKLLQLNKITKVNYKNPDYLASYGFRTTRRVKTGSGGPDAASSRMSHDSVLQSVMQQFIQNCHYNMTNGSSFKLHGGGKFSSQDLVEALKKFKPRKGVLKGREVLNNKLFGQRQEFEDGKKKGKNYKPERARHAQNYAKSIRSITDLAERLLVILRGVENYDEFLKKTNYEGKEVPNIISWLSQAATSASDYSGEQEWVVRKTANLTHGKKCPNCGTFVTGEDDAYVTCKKCGTKVKIEGTEQGALHKPVLHVPEGSTLFIQENSDPNFTAWVQNYITKNKKPDDTRSNTQFIIDEFKLYNKFHVSFVPGIPNKTDDHQGKTYDPDAYETQQKIGEYLKKGINRVEMLQKLLEKKDGIPASKFRNYLAKWERLGIISVEGNEIKLLDPDFDEDASIIFSYIKKSAEPQPESNIKTHTHVDDKNLQRVLKKLSDQDKIQKLNDGTWAIKLSDSEMNSESELEALIMDYLKNNQVQAVHQIDLDDFTTEEIAYAFKLLRLKNRIYLSNIFRIWKPTVDSSQPMSEKELAMIEFLKKHPVSDQTSIQEELGIDASEAANTAESLAARGEITVEKHGNKWYASLDSKKHKVEEGAKFWPKKYDVVMEIIKKHYLTTTHEIAALSKEDDYYTINPMVNYLIHKDKVKNDNQGRIINTHESLPPAETVEGKVLINYLKEHKHGTPDQLSSHITAFHENKVNFDSIHELLRSLMEEKIVGSIKDYISETNEYFLTENPYEIDFTEYKDKIKELLKDFKEPASAYQLRDKYGDVYGTYISSEGMDGLLEQLIKDNAIAQDEDVFGTHVYRLPDQPKAASIDVFLEKLNAILDQFGPSTMRKLREELHKATDKTPSYCERIIEKLSEDQKIKQLYIPQYSFYIYEKLDGMDAEQYTAIIEKHIMEFLETNGWSKPEQIAVFLKNKLSVAIDSYYLLEHITNMADENKIKKEKNWKGTWFGPLNKESMNTDEEIISYVEKHTAVSGLDISNHISGNPSNRMYGLQTEMNKLEEAGKVHKLALVPQQSDWFTTCFYSTHEITFEQLPLFKKIESFLKDNGGHKTVNETLTFLLQSDAPDVKDLHLNTVASLLKTAFEKKLVYCTGRCKGGWAEIKYSLPDQKREFNPDDIMKNIGVGIMSSSRLADKIDLLPDHAHDYMNALNQLVAQGQLHEVKIYYQNTLSEAYYSKNPITFKDLPAVTYIETQLSSFSAPLSGKNLMYYVKNYSSGGNSMAENTIKGIVDEMIKEKLLKCANNCEQENFAIKDFVLGNVELAPCPHCHKMNINTVHHCNYCYMSMKTAPTPVAPQPVQPNAPNNPAENPEQ